jgi:hypothetical protein
MHTFTAADNLTLYIKWMWGLGASASFSLAPAQRRLSCAHAHQSLNYLYFVECVDSDKVMHVGAGAKRQFDFLTEIA